MYVLGRSQRERSGSTKRDGSPAHVVHQVQTELLHAVENLVEGRQVVKCRDRVHLPIIHGEGCNRIPRLGQRTTVNLGLMRTGQYCSSTYGMLIRSPLVFQHVERGQVLRQETAEVGVEPNRKDRLVVSFGSCCWFCEERTCTQVHFRDGPPLRRTRQE